MFVRSEQQVTVNHEDEFRNPFVHFTVIFDPGPSGVEFKRDELKCESMMEIPPTKRPNNLSTDSLMFFL